MQHTDDLFPTVKPITLTFSQLNNILNQLDLYNVKIPTTDIKLYLEPSQLSGLGCSIVTMPDSRNLPTVSSLITSVYHPTYSTRINSNYIRYLSDLLDIPEQRFIDSIHNTVGTLKEITEKFNTIFSKFGLSFSQAEISQLLSII